MSLGTKQTFRSFDGEELYYHITGEGPVMLLANGIVCTTQYWPPIIDYFKEFFTVVSWDYRGHGSNQPPRLLDTCNIPAATEDMRAILDHIGAQDAVLMGHSMGSQVVLEFARRFPQRTKGLISICGSCESPFRGTKGGRTLQQSMMKRLTRLAHPIPGVTARVIKPLLKTPLTMELTYRLGANRDLIEKHYIDSLYAHVTQMDFAVSVRFIDSMINHSVRHHLANIRTPTFLIGGGKDALVPPKTIHELQQHIPFSEAKIYDNGSHLAMLERFEDATRDMMTFLTRRVLL
jgi:pimeloyl-ACP methyl ester carboxylesterase